jgi:hypothetical protein
MVTEGVDVRISLQRLLIGLLLMIVPLSVAGLYVTDRGDNALQQAIGSHFKIIADSKADQISQFVNDAVMEVGAIAAASTVAEEAAAAKTTRYYIFCVVQRARPSRVKLLSAISAVSGKSSNPYLRMPTENM